MAELPTPHSIAIGTLISLYSDPNSPLVALNSWRDNDDDDDHDHDHDHDDHDDDDRGGVVDGMGPPRSDAEWRLRLTSLLRQIVLNEDEGHVVLDPAAGEYGEYGDYGEEEEEEDATRREDGDHAAAGDRRRDDETGFDYLWVDPIRDCDYHLDGDGDGGDGDGDVIGHHRPLATGRGSSMADEPGGGDGRGMTSLDDDAPRPFLVGRALPRPDRRVVCAASLGFRMETLSTLLDRIDDAFYQRAGGRRGGEVAALARPPVGADRGVRVGGRFNEPPRLVARSPGGDVDLDDVRDDYFARWGIDLRGVPAQALPRHGGNTLRGVGTAMGCAGEIRDGGDVVDLVLVVILAATTTARGARG